MDTPEWCKLQGKLFQAVVKGVNVVTVKQKGAAFASTARFFSQKSIVTLISDREFLEDCVDMLMDVELCVVQVAHVFILDFLRKLNDCALTFIYRSMSGRLGVQAERMSRSKDDFNHLFNQKRLHYIAGSSAKSVVRHADRYPHNGRLQRRKKCVRNRLSVAGSSVVSQANKASHWTKLMNRMNLIFSPPSCFEKAIQRAYANDLVCVCVSVCLSVPLEGDVLETSNFQGILRSTPRERNAYGKSWQPTLRG
ncbi:uncharacterized protein LOC127751232 [Frankliniella occidentalis]|uniref:Uncharacterized protein LOC127751232 n=1 Tax=Frankliniella occidentalis TaxID=133901 RepID=A0A9C6X767_FRAOC|nr:uncharacterized protein LOC127751232 [Frankliniella occidentalis]